MMTNRKFRLMNALLFFVTPIGCMNDVDRGEFDKGVDGERQGDTTPLAPTEMAGERLEKTAAVSRPASFDWGDLRPPANLVLTPISWPFPPPPDPPPYRTNTDPAGAPPETASLP